MGYRLNGINHLIVSKGISGIGPLKNPLLFIMKKALLK